MREPCTLFAGSRARCKFPFLCHHFLAFPLLHKLYPFCLPYLYSDTSNNEYHYNSGVNAHIIRCSILQLWHDHHHSTECFLPPQDMDQGLLESAILYPPTPIIHPHKLPGKIIVGWPHPLLRQCQPGIYL